MKAVLISMQPKWCELIANGKKTVDVRKAKPKLETPFKVYIYCTKGKPTLGRCLKDNSLKVTQEIDFDNYNKDTLFRANGKVIGEFVCNEIQKERPKSLYASHKIAVNSCVSIKELIDYAGEKEFIYFWNISNLAIYDKPKELNNFYVPVKDYWETYDPSNYINGCWQKPLQKPPQSWCYVESE